MSRFSEYIGSQFGNPRGITGAVCCFLMNVINRAMYRETAALICTQPHRKVLDIGYGNGYLLKCLDKALEPELYGIDISPEMAKIAAKKYPMENVEIVCGDVETTELGRDFDRIVVYNAFPHFPEPEKLIRRLAELLKPGGRLTIAHGMSRAAIDSHHSGIASRVSVGLMHEDQLAELMTPYLRVVTKISDERMYQLVGERVQNA